MADLGKDDVKEEEKPEEAEGSEGQESLADKFARLEKENTELRQTTQASLSEASAARGQVQLILDQIQRAAASGDQGAVKAEKSIREKFDDDPMAAVNELFTMRMGPVIQEYFGRQADAERAAAFSKNTKQFEKYGREVDEFMKDMPLDVKAKPGSYEAALKYVRSQHLEEEVEQARKEERERASLAEGASAAEPDKKERRALTREEREVMKEGFDMSEEEWARWGTPGGVKPTKSKGKAA
jgi:hypothetical protein